jgi:hypothetical protein
MKKINLAALLAIVGAGVAAQSAHATLSYTPGDLFIGFRNTTAGVTEDYLIDVGQASLYTKQNGSSFTLNIGGTQADLIQAFGSAWQTGGKTFWGVIGAEESGDPASTLYVGKKEATFGTFPTATGTTYLRDTTGNQAGTLSSEQTMRIDYQSSSATTNSTVGAFQLTTDTNAWLNFSQGSAFGTYAAFEANISGTTTAGHALDLFQIAPDDATPGTQNPVYQGRFVISNSGQITYTSAGAVPEPSTLVTLAGGAALMGLVRRRRAVAA